MSDPDNNFINIVKVSVSQSLVCIRIPGNLLEIQILS